jgi:2-polyprenyl-3-methyl-5-hydroxy-6-metoxy-1,4-benzoquinol methylase
MSADNIALLRARSTSPYAPEPPRKSVIVSALMRRRHSALQTPHLSGGSDLDKCRYEYDGADEFWSSLEGVVKPDVLRGRDVLDVGCGWGGKMVHFAEHTGLKHITGFDLPGVFKTEVADQFARSKGVTNCRFLTGYAESMPVEDHAYDVILMEDVMEHVADPELVLRECVRVLRPGGTLIVKFPSFISMRAHHLDRAIGMPGAHRLLSMKTWAAGLNQLLLERPDLNYEPFDEVVPTRFRSSVTRNLNGMDFDQFRRLVGKTVIRPQILRLMPFPASGGRWPLLKRAYRRIFSAGVAREFLASFILLVGVTDGADAAARPD